MTKNCMHKKQSIIKIGALTYFPDIKNPNNSTT